MSLYSGSDASSNYQSLGLRDKINLIASQLKVERSSWEDHWQQLADFTSPNKVRFTTTDTNRGERVNEDVIDISPALALRTFKSGMMEGMTPTSSPWFKLGVADPDLMEYGPVKEWLALVEDRMRVVHSRSNLYTTLPITYGEIGNFGTNAIWVEEDFDNIIHFHSLPLGQYWVGADSKGRVNLLYREFRLTVRQIVDYFGRNIATGKIDWDNISNYVRKAWDRGSREIWVDLAHIVMPNDDWDPTRRDKRFMRYKSVYYELGSQGLNSGSYTADDKDKTLKEDGFGYFPSLVSRWEVVGNDVYGSECPGMVALGEVKAIQIMREDMLLGVEMSLKPPLVGDPILENTNIPLIPGGVTFVPEMLSGKPGLRPIHQIQPHALTAMKEEILEARRIISRAYYEEFFIMLAQSDRRQITAREIEERHGEKLMALGSLMDQLNQDLLDPLIDITFQMMLRRGWVPPPPEELQGQELDVEYISVMAQAKKRFAVGGMERVAGFIGQLATADPSVLHKLNFDQLVDEYSMAMGTPVSIIRTDEEVAKIREQIARAQQQQAMMQQIQEGARTAKDLSQAKLEDENVLSRLAGGGTR